MEAETLRQTLAFFADKGLIGKNGEPGKDGLNGQNGAPGIDGRHGYNGKDGRHGINGKDGAPGRDGKDGRDGYSLPGLPGRDGRDGRDGLYVVSSAIMYESDHPFAKVIGSEDTMNDGSVRRRLIKTDGLGRAIGVELDSGTV